MSITSFDGTVALITGGASGIGFGLAQALVERGGRVALIGTDQARLDAAVARLGAGAIGVELDVTDRAGWPIACSVFEAKLGPIDLAILNAGAQGGRHRIENVEPDEWDWVWSVNVGGIYNGLRASLPAMRARGFGHVLITASIAALMPRATVSAYGASKAAALAIAESTRLELADSGIGISVLCPGLVNTPIAETMRRHAPASDENTFNFMAPTATHGLDPLAVGRFTLDAVAAGHFYIFTHPELAEVARNRLGEIDLSLEMDPT
jgi:NAD(P)-dependent dehydrogenase (short-subunit alcohol dehydrogenase family)